MANILKTWVFRLNGNWVLRNNLVAFSREDFAGLDDWAVSVMLCLVCRYIVIFITLCAYAKE